MKCILFNATAASVAEMTGLTPLDFDVLIKTGCVVALVLMQHFNRKITTSTNDCMVLEPV